MSASRLRGAPGAAPSPAGSRWAKPCRSPPAQKARPVPVRMTARTVSSSAADSTAASVPSSSSRLIVFMCWARSSVIVATPPSTAYRTTSSISTSFRCIVSGMRYVRGGTGFDVELREPGIALVTFNEPDRLNGMTQGMKRDLLETIQQAQMDDAVRVLVFTGTGRAFCAGDDLTGGYQSAEPELTPPLPGGHGTPIGTYDGLRAISQSVNVALRNLDKLTVAAINGYAIQIGLSLALACDFRIASSEARLGSATLRFGLLPDEGGQYLLVQLVGVGRAMDFLMRKRIVSAAEALDLGLVNEVVTPADLLDRALTLAGELAEGPQVAMRLLKRSIYVAAEVSFAQALEDIALRTAVTDHHSDAREGVQAFRQKRQPAFNQQLEG